MFYGKAIHITKITLLLSYSFYVQLSVADKLQLKLHLQTSMHMANTIASIRA